MPPDIEAMSSELESFLNAIELRDPIRDDEVTIDAFCQLRGIGRSAAERTLAAEVKAGRMVRRKAFFNGRAGYAYSLPKK